LKRTRIVTLGAAVAILGAIFPLAVCAQTDQAALLERARAKIIENMERLPKYTCLQTVNRARFEPLRGVQMSGCGDLKGSKPRDLLAWRDRFKLDVTVAQGAEIFSWAGDRQFQSGEVEQIVGGGMTGTGDFGPFLMSIFDRGAGSGAADYQYLGLEKDRGRSLAAYRYRVPLARSNYQIRIGTRPGDLATLEYEGRFWIDAETADIAKMTIEAPDPPRASDTCRVETAIDYRRGQISGSEFLLPLMTVVTLWGTEGTRFENRIEYAGCRKFQSESVFRTEMDGVAGGVAIAKAPVAIPNGVTLKIALRTTIDSGKAFAGDAIEGRLVEAIRGANKQVVAPAGATVHGRIVRFERHYQPSNYFVVGLAFHSIEVGGSEVPLVLAAVARSRREQALAGAVERRQGIGMFVFPSDPLVLDQEFVSEWKTAGRTR
jgi:hypothetical protein